MKLEQSFTVTAPVEQVWAMLIDVERVAPCLPGAEITGQTPDGAYEGTFSVRLGPATAAYNGSLRMESADESSHTATMSAKGTDKRGQGGANATIVSSLRQDGDDTTVEVATDFTITGRLARFGRGGMIEDISKRLMRDFAQCLQATLAAEQEAGVAPAAAAEAPDEAAPAPDASVPAPDAPAPGAPPAEPTAAEAAAASPLPGQEAADEPLQPAQAPWPPRAPEPEPAAAEPEAAAGEPTPPADAPLPEAAAADAPPAEAADTDAPAPAESPAAPAAEPLAPAEPAATESAAPGEPAATESAAAGEPPATEEPPAAAAATPTTPPPPRTGSIPPPTAATRPAAQPAKPISGFSLFFGVLWDRVKRFFGRLFGRKREN